MVRYKPGRDGPTYSPSAAVGESFTAVPWAETLLRGSAGSAPHPALPSPELPRNNQGGGYCPACFKNFRSDFRSLDENGNCKIHGGQLGQHLDVSKTTQVIAGVGVVGAALAFLIAASRK